MKSYWFSGLTIDSTWLLVLLTYYWFNMTAVSLDLLLIQHDCWFSGLTIVSIINLINLIYMDLWWENIQMSLFRVSFVIKPLHEHCISFDGFLVYRLFCANKRVPDMQVTIYLANGQVSVLPFGHVGQFVVFNFSHFYSSQSC